MQLFFFKKKLRVVKGQTVSHKKRLKRRNVFNREFSVICCHPSSSQAAAGELSSGQLEGKAITSMSPLYSVPVFAVGCADGFIRLWNYEARGRLATAGERDLSAGPAGSPNRTESPLLWLGRYPSCFLSPSSTLTLIVLCFFFLHGIDLL